MTDIQQTLNLLPGVIPMWANMLPRRVWHGAAGNKVLDQARRELNRQTRKVIPRHRGAYLSTQGCDLYLKNLTLGINAVTVLSELGGGMSRLPPPSQ